jgi:hypothetical protein
MSVVGRTKVLLFQSWVSNVEWYTYARQNPNHVPYLLVDRSPCQEPFFDLLAPTPEERRPLVSGLCRLVDNYVDGDQFIYVTRVDSQVCPELGIEFDGRQIPYLGVAALLVKRVWTTHDEAAAQFRPRRYVSSPATTAFPPNLAHREKPDAAAARETSILFDKKKPVTPDRSTTAMWRLNYRDYHHRATGICGSRQGHRLRVAECQYVHVDGRLALQESHLSAPLLHSNDWGGTQMNTGGIIVGRDVASDLCRRIAIGTARTSLISQ